MQVSCCLWFLTRSDNVLKIAFLPIFSVDQAVFICRRNFYDLKEYIYSPDVIYFSFIFVNKRFFLNIRSLSLIYDAVCRIGAGPRQNKILKSDTKTLTSHCLSWLTEFLQ
jgi:hypothetical protein